MINPGIQVQPFQGSSRCGCIKKIPIRFVLLLWTVLLVGESWAFETSPTPSLSTTASDAREQRQTEDLLASAEAFGNRLAGVLWIRDGRKLGSQLLGTPMGRFTQQIHVAGLLSVAGRWMSGLPLSREGFELVLQGPALVVWVAPSSSSGEAGQTNLDSDPAPAKKVIRPEPLLLVSIENSLRRQIVLEWLASDGFDAAKQKYADLTDRLDKVGDVDIHVWERTTAPPDKRVVLSYAYSGNSVMIAGSEVILSDFLDVRNLEPSRDPTPLAQRALQTIQFARSSGSGTAALFDVHAFTVFRSIEWLRSGLGVGMIRDLTDRVANFDESTSRVVHRVQDRMDRLGNRVGTGGFSDLRWMEVVYYPDSALPYSRIRLVFDEEAQTWIEELAASRPSRLADLAPSDTVAYWSLHVPSRLTGRTRGEGGPEIGRFFVPTEFRVAPVTVIEAPVAAAFLRTQMNRADDFFSSTTLQMPVQIPLSGSWAKFKEMLRAFEPWMPLTGMRWKIRIVGDYLAFGISAESMEKIAAVDRAEAPSLRAERSKLFQSPQDVVEQSDLGEGRIALERFNDLAWRAQSVRGLDIVEFPFLKDPSQDSALFEINWLALAQKIPKVQEWLSTLPPLYSRVLWYPEAATMEIHTRSATGLPGDLRVWGAVGAALIPTFDLDPSGWNIPIDKIKDVDLQRLDPRNWMPNSEEPQ